MSSEQKIVQEKMAPASNAPGTEIQKCEQEGPSARSKSKSSQIESASSSEIKLTDDVNALTSARKCGGDKSTKTREAENILVAIKKRQKKLDGSHFDSVAVRSASSDNFDLSDSHHEIEDDAPLHKLKSMKSRKPRRRESQVLESDKSLPAGVASGASNEIQSEEYMTGSSGTSRKEEFGAESMYKQQQRDNKYWKPLEKALCEKGFQIFGRNRFSSNPCSILLSHFPLWIFFMFFFMKAWASIYIVLVCSKKPIYLVSYWGGRKITSFLVF